MAEQLTINGQGNEIAYNTPVNGLRWWDYLAITYRLNTTPGHHLRRPDYGLDLSERIDQPVDLTLIRLILQNSLRDVKSVERVIVTSPRPLEVLIRIIISGVSEPTSVGNRPWSIQWAVQFGGSVTISEVV